MKLFLTVLLGLFAFTLQAQTADEIIQKHAGTMGGLDAMNAIKTLKITGTMSTQGMDLPLISQIVNGKAVRTEIEVMGQQVIQVYNNGTGWTINPFNGATEATDLTGQQLLDAKSLASVASNLVDYKNRGHQAELLGQEEVEGVKCYKLKLTYKEDSKPAYFFINASDYTLIKMSMTREVQGQDMEAESYYSNRKEIGGIWFFMSRIQKLNGEIYAETQYDKIELNVPVDESIFKK